MKSPGDAEISMNCSESPVGAAPSDSEVEASASASPEQGQSIVVRRNMSRWVWVIGKALRKRPNMDFWGWLGCLACHTFIFKECSPHQRANRGIKSEEHLPGCGRGLWADATI